MALATRTCLFFALLVLSHELLYTEEENLRQSNSEEAPCSAKAMVMDMVKAKVEVSFEVSVFSEPQQQKVLWEAKLGMKLETKKPNQSPKCLWEGYIWASQNAQVQHKVLWRAQASYSFQLQLWRDTYVEACRPTTPGQSPGDAHYSINN